MMFRRVSIPCLGIVASFCAALAHADDEAIRLKVSATSQTRSEITARKGERFRIVASGYWKMGGFVGSCSPDGFPPGEYANYSITGEANHGALIVRSGYGDWQTVGAYTTITADADGPLVFSPNDTERGNNSGELSVSVVRLDNAPRKRAERQQPQEQQVYARAGSSATKSGIYVRKGQVVKISATGTWKMGSLIGFCDADGMTFAGDADYNRFRNAKHGSLMAYVDGDDGWYACGSSFSFTADVGGELVFAPNDNEVGNNSGSLLVTVTVKD